MRVYDMRLPLAMAAVGTTFVNATGPPWWPGVAQWALTAGVIILLITNFRQLNGQRTGDAPERLDRPTGSSE
ncbi:hypothetical protein ACFFQW_38475 [Umezawaea endophytica]|uniref:Uncharacterized protein n=1 Tax=Umezawaea endophytica TaxID=1654476 RepID=A0A9X2VW90_9PSEU|nr:hypothetical protein [Umezawaea endophytica]MCS7483830.1 hypothetical protein [Umezawaea endophytica]